MRGLNSKVLTSDKMTYIAGDFNLNVINYATNIKVKSFANTAFEHELTPMIKKPLPFIRHQLLGSIILLLILTIILVLFYIEQPHIANPLHISS